MTFKEQVALDIHSIFMNVNEFSDKHIINGREMAVQIDNNEMLEREKRYRNKQDMYTDGIYLKELLIFVAAEEFGKLPTMGSVIEFDGEKYTVTDAIDEDGIYSISLNANRTGRR